MIIEADDIINFIRNGRVPHVAFGESTDLLMQKIPQEAELMGPDETLIEPGYLYYDGIRYGFSNKIVNEFGLDFWHIKKKVKFVIRIELYEENFVLSRNTTLLEFLYLLNGLEIEWKMFGGDPGIPPIVYTNYVGVDFDPYNGRIGKISTTDNFRSPFIYDYNVMMRRSKQRNAKKT